MASSLQISCCDSWRPTLSKRTHLLSAATQVKADRFPTHNRFRIFSVGGKESVAPIVLISCVLRRMNTLSTGKFGDFEMVSNQAKGLRCCALDWLLSVAVPSIAFSTLACTQTVDNSNTVAIGLLLPFSGADTGTSANFERAAIYATESVNAAGGIRGKRLRLVGADTHSSGSRGIESGKHLINEGVEAVLGMESSDIAAQLEPIFFEQGVALISPLVGTADDTSVDCTNHWFRLAPAARTLGEALAKRLSVLLVPSVIVLSTTDSYSKAFGDSVVSRFTSLGGTVALRAELDATAESFGEVLDQVTRTGVSDVVLSASPSAAAWIVNEAFATLSTRLNWYLSPLLKTGLLIENVAPGALNNAQGVAPKIADTQDSFPQAFKSRWQGELPLEGAYFYYDAVAMVAYALQLAANESTVGADAFIQAVSKVTGMKGVGTGWNEFKQGLDGIEAGQAVYYAGLTGPILFDDCGARTIGTVNTWSVQNGQIVNDPQ